MERKKTVAFFSFEVALNQKMRTYGGGLGVVSGAMLKSAGRMNEIPVDMVGVSILWRQGYYDQCYGPNGMAVEYRVRNYDKFLDDPKQELWLDICHHSNKIKIWELKPETFRSAPVIFLDSDVEGVDELPRLNTRVLYSANECQRLAQEIILGIGGVRAMEKLGISIDINHINEGHCVLAAIEVLRRELARGLNFREALEATRKKVVFTTHTPEIAGNEIHSIDLMSTMGCFPGLTREQVQYIGGDPANFNMTVAALRLAGRANAVSKLHYETASKMWAWVPDKAQIAYVTNGVDPDWQYPEFAKASTPEEIEKAKAKYKRILLRHIKKRTKKEWKEDIPTMVWARRWAGYKRPKFVFLDEPWFVNLLNGNKLQMIFAGKPHPEDLGMVNVWNEIYRKSQAIPNIAILTGYELGLSKLLKAGCDFWLQTPRRPREACGTSWISANMNGALVVSSRDGGILESSNEENGFLFGVDYPSRTEGEQDSLDFHDFVRVLGKAMEMYCNDKPAWYKKALAAKWDAEKNFNSDRMLTDYIQRMYL